MDDHEALCRKIYSETNDRLREAQANMPSLGFRVLYGPPFLEPPYFFIGYQPGGRETLAQWEALGFHESWPERCDYAEKDWAFAKKLKTIFGKEVLEKSVGANAIFFRCPSVREWKEDRSLASLRQELTDFSLPRVEQIVRTLQPRRIVVIGLGTSNLLEINRHPVLMKNGRTLVRQGELWGIAAYGIIHLSGARLSHADIEALRTFFQAEASASSTATIVAA